MYVKPKIEIYLRSFCSQGTNFLQKTVSIENCLNEPPPLS